MRRHCISAISRVLGGAPARFLHKFDVPDPNIPVDTTFIPAPGKVFLPYVVPTFEASVHNLNFEEVEKVVLNPDVFNAPLRKDIVHRVVEWERAASRRVTHWIPNRVEINKTGKKIWPQKGSGRARHRDRYVAIFPGGGKSFGPKGPRDYSYRLQQKVVEFGHRIAMTAKYQEGNFFILDQPTIDSHKTKDFVNAFQKWGVHRPLLLYEEDEMDPNFILGVRNLKYFNLYPAHQAPLFEIIRHHELIFTKSALMSTQERLTRLNPKINFVCPPLQELIAAGEIKVTAPTV
jgi:large subunit ribosomal protein L4